MELNREIKVLDKGFVRLVDYMGDDTSIVQAARVSYGEGSKGPEADAKLIGYLLKNRHTSPFEQVQLKFHIKAPIFVFRQWHRHRTWSYNEISARYTELGCEFYLPDLWRKQATTNKQDSIEDPEFMQIGLTKAYREACYETVETYKWLLSRGVSREQARMVLPVSIYSEMYASVDLHNLLHFLKLRLDPHAQWEIREYAKAILELITPIVPVTIAKWKSQNDSQAPETSH